MLTTLRQTKQNNTKSIRKANASTSGVLVQCRTIHRSYRFFSVYCSTTADKCSKVSISGKQQEEQRGSPAAFRRAVFLLHFHFLQVPSIHSSSDTVFSPLLSTSVQKLILCVAFLCPAHLSHFVLLLLCPLLYFL